MDGYEQDTLQDKNIGETSRNEGAGENTPAPQNIEIWQVVYKKLVQIQHEAVKDPNCAEDLQAHFNRLPPRYGIDVNLKRPEDVITHQDLLKLAVMPEKRPAFSVCLSERMEQPGLVADVASSSLNEDNLLSPDPCLNLKDLVLESSESALDLGISRSVQNDSLESAILQCCIFGGFLALRPPSSGTSFSYSLMISSLMLALEEMFLFDPK